MYEVLEDTKTLFCENLGVLTIDLLESCFFSCMNYENLSSNCMRVSNGDYLHPQTLAQLQRVE